MSRSKSVVICPFCNYSWTPGRFRLAGWLYSVGTYQIEVCKVCGKEYEVHMWVSTRYFTHRVKGK